MTYTEDQKREALACVENGASKDFLCALDECGCPSVLAHFLRLAESELAEANHIKDTYAERIKEWEQRAHSLTRATNPQDFFRIFTDYRDSLSALRAENEALKARLSGAVVHDELQVEEINRAQASEKAAEAKLTRLAEALRTHEHWTNDGTDHPEYSPHCDCCVALRETEGGAK